MQPTRPADERPNLLRPLRLKPVQREAPRFASGDVEDDAADAPDESSQGEILERPLVYVRVRPDGADNAKSEGGIKVDGTNVTYPVPKKDRKNTISVEHVFEETASQEDVFQKVVREQVMTYILQGFRACIFAFGITGSGKSYTILGNGEQVESQGLLQRTIQDLFAQDLDNFSMSMQAIQLHRHRFEDLGVAQKELAKVNSTMHVDKTDCSEHKFDSAAPALEWLDGALTRRNVKATGGNKVSSRSYLVVRVKLQFTLDGEGRNAVLDVVDLAGSERIRTDLDEETSKDHIAIQAGLSCLQNCIESKIHNVKLPQNQQRLVPFTHFPLTKLLAPDFTGDAIVAMILTFSTKLDRAAEVAETLHFTSRMLGFRIAAKKQGVTVQAQKFEDLMARALPRPSESQKPELPMTKAVSVKAQKLHELEKQQNEELREEVRRLRLQLEQLEKEVVSPLGALASELKELAKASETQPASADLISRARKVMQDMQEKYPQDVKMIWANWSEDLQPGKIKGDLKEFTQHFRQLEHRVVQHEKDICSLMERRAALQTMAKNGEAGELHRRQLEVLDALLAEATEGRPSLREFLSSWEQQWRDLLEKRQELRDLEAAAASSMENSEARHMPLAETLDADWAQWSNGGVSEIERLIEELPASSQRIIHLHQARPECGKILHESGVRKMLDTMEKTKKRYWHEELANCLGHVFDPQMLPDMERSDFCKRLGQQAIERVKGSDRLASGDMESNFSLNDTSRESSVQIYMDFMKTIAKHPDAQAVLASSEDVVRAILAFIKHRSQPVAVAAFGALGQISPASELINKENLIFILKIIVANDESAGLRKAAAYCLQRFCSGPGANRLRPMMEALDVVPHMLQVASDATAKEDEAAIFKHAKNVASLLLDGLNTAQVAKGLSYRQAVLEAIGCAAIDKFSEGRLDGMAAGMKYWGQVNQGSWAASASAMVTAGGGLDCSTFWMNPMYLIRFTEEEKKSTAMALTLSSLESLSDADRKMKKTAFMCFRLFNLSSISKDASERQLNDEIVKHGQNLPTRSSKQAVGPKVCYEQETSFYVNEVDNKDDHLLVVYTLDPLQEKKFALSVFSDSALEVTPLPRDGWQMRSFLGQWRSPAPAQSYGNPLDMFWHGFPQLMITNSSTSEVTISCILSYQAQDERKTAKHKMNEMPQEVAAQPEDSFPFLEMELFDASAQPLHRYVGFGKPKVQTLVLCRDWVVLKAQLPPQSAHSLVLGRSWFQNDGGAKTPETPAYAQDFRLQLLADYGDLDLQPISAGFEWHRFAATPVLVRDHRPWHMKLQLKTACAQKQHVHLLLRIPDQVKAFMRLKVLKDGQDVSPVVSQGKGDAFLPLIHNEYELEGSLEFDMTVEFHPQSETGAFPLLVQGLSRSCDGELHFLAGDDRKDVGLEMMKDATMQKWLEQVSAEPFSKRNPQISSDLQLEPQAFPACSQTESADDELITVSKAYLQRLFNLAKAQEAKP